MRPYLMFIAAAVLAVVAYVAVGGWICSAGYFPKCSLNNVGELCCYPGDRKP